MSHLNLNSCADSSITFIKSTISKEIQIGFSKAKNIQPIFGDEQQIEQVLINLLVNATHALEHIPKPVIYVSLKQIEGYVICKIKDNGPGIHISILQKVWNPFFTTKDKVKGTGLGLAICKDIIQGHQGFIDYTGDDTGAEFTIKLPVQEV